jgi:hypothetical protein
MGAHGWTALGEPRRKRRACGVLGLLLWTLGCGAAAARAHDGVPDVPEPMVFDLVHSLGVERGALEVNVLSLVPVAGGQDPVDWAPEIEYAIRDGLAVEAELVFADDEIEAYKGAAQFTFGVLPAQRAIHGSQLLLEVFDDEDRVEFTALYLYAREFDAAWSTVAMAGVQAVTGEDVDDHQDLQLNATLFRTFGPRWSFGLENDLLVEDRGSWSLLVYPHVLVEFADRVELQLGGGAQFGDDETDYSVGMRLIYSTAE